MCRPIFGTVKSVVLDSVFCVAKGIAYLKAKGMYEGAMINNYRYWTKGVTGNLIDTHFQDCYSKCNSNRTRGKPMPTGGYNNIEAQSGVCTKYEPSNVGVRTNTIMRHSQKTENKSKS